MECARRSRSVAIQEELAWRMCPVTTHVWREKQWSWHDTVCVIANYFKQVKVLMLVVNI
jgi:hypothetical protein